MRLWDAHMHSCFSGDCSTPIENMILSAQKKGLRGITFTDHLDWDYRESPGLFDLDLHRYRQTIRHLQEKYNSEDFEILYGIELGLQPQLAERHKKLLESTPFDFVIGSSHVVHGVDPYYPAYFKNRSPKEAYTEYYESILENIRAFDGFDSYGHLDYVFRYGPQGTSADTYSDYASVIDTILAELIHRDKALEVNTGAYRCGLTQPNPGIQIIKRYRQLGGTLITLGADAHTPGHIGLCFEQARKLLTDLGYKEYCVYRRHVPEFYKLQTEPVTG